MIRLFVSLVIGYWKNSAVLLRVSAGSTTFLATIVYIGYLQLPHTVIDPKLATLHIIEASHSCQHHRLASNMKDSQKRDIIRRGRSMGPSHWDWLEGVSIYYAWWGTTGIGAEIGVN